MPLTNRWTAAHTQVRMCVGKETGREEEDQQCLFLSRVSYNNRVNDNAVDDRDGPQHLSYQIQSHQISLSLTTNRYGTIRVIAAASREIQRSDQIIPFE